jgi:hypothetical protein
MDPRRARRVVRRALVAAARKDRTGLRSKAVGARKVLVLAEHRRRDDPSRASEKAD